LPRQARDKQGKTQKRVYRFLLAQKFKGTPQAGLIKAMYAGEYDDCVICKGCGNKAGAGASGFTSLDLAIREFGSTEPIASIQEGLKKYFKSETLDGDNQYHCEKCEKEGRGAKQDAEKGLKLSKVPYILSIGLKRFEYDWERDCRAKVDDRVSKNGLFEPFIYINEHFAKTGSGQT
jgi:ubiquitin carboxyl-terminal hydrolase 47